MLDSDTKRRIDTCRDILVGKVPDPKSQVEQITVALIYKFMNDMDLEAEELGGARKFFTDEYERYRWSNLVASGVSGQDMLNTYSEALTKMVENEKLPPLFRAIFRNAYLPYRDPETLRSFLREIDSFEYDHSERLGDAFEYLLSVLGSQGDAGQFRTPRHIIDFMVEIIDPKKNETIMDPACGTAGFLISAYKHILKANSSAVVPSPIEIETKDASEQTIDSPLRYSGDKLTTKDRAGLAKNIFGYDISPDMVRLSLVNLYLHGFADPKIEEYDTLTSEAKWGEMADVVLANPPFMSPKGGIKPHNRFQVQSKRSEVLFVDYIAEHLTKAGRAAIVVPEGIIFQSQNAYKALRKMLVENHLAAVISLPGGVFNPYSGVKTSILILDRALAKASDHIAFFKVENDGFALGAQRRAQKGSELPRVKAQLNAWMEDARKGKSETLDSTLGFAVERKRIVEEGDYNLSAERYAVLEKSQSAFDMVSFADETIFQVQSGGTPKSTVEEFWNGSVQWATLVDLPQENFITEIVSTKRTITNEGLAASSAKLLPINSILVSSRATIGRIAINRVPVATNQGFKNIIIKDSERAISEYVALIMTSLVPTMKAWATGGTFSEISKSKFCGLKIPLPPIDIQREIIEEIESYQKVIDGARNVIDNYKPRITIEPDWPIPKFENAPVQIIDGDRGKNYPSKSDFTSEGHCLFLNTSNVRPDGFLFERTEFISAEKDAVLRKGKLVQGDVVLTTRGTIGNTGLYDCSVTFEHIRINSGMLIFRPDTNELKSEYLFAYFQSQNFVSQRQSAASGSAQPQLPIRSLKNIKVPIPSIETQDAIISEIQAEKKIVAGNLDLITRFEKKIRDAISRVWGEAETDI